jgi:hypothetical protein
LGYRKDSDVSLERRVKRLLRPYRLDLLKPERPEPRVLAHGGYKLRDSRTGTIVFGETPYPFCKTLEEIETYIEGLNASD